MAAERVPMRKLREVLRLRLACGLSGRAIAQSCRLSGSWLVVAQIPSKSEPAGTAASLWDVSAPGGKLDVTLRQVDLLGAERSRATGST
jgi:hypothetical protein